MISRPVNLEISNFYINKWQKLYPNYFENIINYNSNGIKTFIRSNALKISLLSLKSLLQKKKIFIGTMDQLDQAGLVKEAKIGIGNLHEYLKGFYSIQGLASQIPVHCFNFDTNNKSSDIRALDMTSAPGNKTAQIASYLKNKYPVVAIEISEKRINKLNSNLRRLGVSNVIVLKGNAIGIVPRLGLFSHILIDAPCSGSGSICRNPQKNYNWSPSKENFEGLISQQINLLAKGVDALKPGGELIYSTCSIEPEENEEIIEKMLNLNPNISLIDLSELKMKFSHFSKYGEIFNEELNKKCIRFLPSEFHEGFFVSKLSKIE